MITMCLKTASAMVALSVVLGPSARADVELVKDGQPVAVIVHNGHTAVSPQIPEKPLGVPAGAILSAAQELQSYLQRITGAELPMAATTDNAGDRPAIVLEVVKGNCCGFPPAPSYAAAKPIRPAAMKDRRPRCIWTAIGSTSTR